MLGQIDAKQLCKYRQEDSFGVSFNDNDTMSEKQVCLRYVEEPLEETVIAPFKSGVVIGRGKGATGLARLEMERRPG